MGAVAEDPVLLITGASSGIGAATARAASESHRLVLAARREQAVESLAAELGGEGRAIALRCDVAEWDQVEAMVGAALESFGRIDAVFANAGFGATRGFLEESPEHWRSMILTNVLGVALTIRATLPQMLERGRGDYVITSSTAGRRPLPGSLYSATKHAVTAIGHALRQELRQMHDANAIRVTLIEPGMVDTPFFDAGAPDWALRDEDIAEAVLYALERPERVEINEVLVVPTRQPS
jgi:NADP-dependent 3-hydroxy acid dehydrogenase YdfG